MKIGDFVYVIEGNSFSYGRIIGFRETEAGIEKIQVNCIDDLYFDLTLQNIFYTKEAFLKQLIFYLKGETE